MSNNTPTQHVFEQNPEAMQVRVCRCGKWPDHQIHINNNEDGPDTHKFTTKSGIKIRNNEDGPDIQFQDIQQEDPRSDPELKTASTEVTRWADKAMFKAEEIDATAGPRVYLLWMTPDPLGAIAAACKMYKGEVVRDLSDVTDRERLEYFQQVQKTKLKAPFEFVKFHFMIEGVTRAFTHQMVRQRTAAYAQESLRFAVKEDMPVGLPPSIPPIGPNGEESVRHEIWNDAIKVIKAQYQRLIELGIPAEDARGLLPHNVLTRLHYTTDLRALLDHAGNRLCTQAQFEWRLVFAKIIEAIRNVSVDQPVFDGVVPRVNGMDRAYMADRLLDAFKPVCFQTGKCEFKANFDRYCSIRERVDAFESMGWPSRNWEDGYIATPVDNAQGRQSIPGIKPGEWLLDSGAARKKSR
jgi:flavin-dependent thymidylate synthase